MEKRNYQTLNAMRGIAALGVMLYHARLLLGIQLFPHGYLAVDLFFVLSGFVIALAYDGRMARGMEWWRFGLTRLIRFYPLFILGLSIGLTRELALIATHNHYALAPAPLATAFVTSAFFVPWPIAHGDYNLFQLNVPAWSLFLELLVNVAYAVLYRKLSKTVLLLIAIIAGIVVIACTLSAGSADLGARAPALLGLDIAGGVARTVCSFSVGLLIYRLKIRWFRVPAPLLLILVAVALAIPASFGPDYDLVFIFLISPSLVILGTSVEPARGAEGFFQKLGIISFPLYAIHRPIIAFAQAVANTTHLPAALLAIGTIVAIIVLSVALNGWYDEPVRAWLTARFNPRVKSDPASDAAP